MRKRISGLMALVCLLVAAASALAAGTTVTTFTPFADMDFAAQGYMDLITAWEDETGNMVEDYSGLEDDLFMEQMQEMVTAGRADLVIVPLGSGLTKDQLVSVDELLAAGFTDSFRCLHPADTGMYSWWSMRFRARERNAGWRIDYFLVSDRVAPNIKEAGILMDIMGSDHCPVSLDIEI